MPIARPWLLALAAVLFAVPQPGPAQTIEYLSTQDALQLEHQTRYSRLKRFVEGLNIQPRPQLYDYVVTADKMPERFRHDVPVLRIVFPENTFFETGSSEVLPSALPVIAAIASMLDGDVPDVNLFVAGHTDDRGGEEYNHALSIARAKAVAEVLVRRRNQSYPIWSIGFGESLPIYPNTTPENMSYNRRVEFLLGAKPEAVAFWLKTQPDITCQTSDSNLKLKCLLGLKQKPRVFVAEEARPRQAATLSVPTRQRVTGQERRQKGADTPKRIVVTLAERRIYVPSIEH